LFSRLIKSFNHQESVFCKSQTVSGLMNHFASEIKSQAHLGCFYTVVFSEEKEISCFHKDWACTNSLSTHMSSSSHCYRSIVVQNLGTC